jgi:transcription elongation GreA/GreB family factor
MKQMVLEEVIRVLEAELTRQLKANAQSNSGAAFSAAGAEKQRDTTGFEAACLARGHAKHAHELRQGIEELKAVEAEDFAGQEIDIGAVVELDMDGETDCYILLNCGGGMEVTTDGTTVTVVTPDSPLGKALMGNVEAGFVSLLSGAEGIILDVF